MIIKPRIFSQFAEIVAAQSTSQGGVSPSPYGLNLSSHVGDDPANVVENRRRFFEAAGVPIEARVVYQSQIHSRNITAVSGHEAVVKDSDALITREPNVVLAVSIADCAPVLIYDPVTRIVAAVHAGWRGTQQEITALTIERMKALGSSPRDMYAFIGACASGARYEVGKEVAEQFHSRYTKPTGDGKYLLDVRRANADQLLDAGMPERHLEISDRCTISDAALHSYRRDGAQAGRMLAIIGRKTAHPR